MLDGTPIYDIKPYIPYTDSHPEASSSFAEADWHRKLEVIFPEELLLQIDKDKRMALIEILEQDPRPAYKADSQNDYGMKFNKYDVQFVVNDGKLRVTKIL